MNEPLTTEDEQALMIACCRFMAQRDCLEHLLSPSAKRVHHEDYEAVWDLMSQAAPGFPRQFFRWLLALALEDVRQAPAPRDGSPWSGLDTLDKIRDAMTAGLRAYGGGGE